LAAPRRTQQERSQLARTSLIEAAINLIYERGFAQVTMADIAARTGFTRGAIQHHFEGRNELVLAILHEVESRVTKSFSEPLAHEKDSVAERIDLLLEHLGEISRAPAYLAVIDIWLASRAEENLRDAVRQSVLRSATSYRQLWQRVFGADIPAKTISDCRRVVVAVLRGMALTSVFTSDANVHQATLATTKAIIRQYMLSNIRQNAAS